MEKASELIPNRCYKDIQVVKLGKTVCIDFKPRNLFEFTQKNT